MPYEYQDKLLPSLKLLGKLLGWTPEMKNVKDPRFCINLEINKGWATCIDLEYEGEILPPQKIMVD